MSYSPQSASKCPQSDGMFHPGLEEPLEYLVKKEKDYNYRVLKIVLSIMPYCMLTSLLIHLIGQEE